MDGGCIAVQRVVPGVLRDGIPLRLRTQVIDILQLIAAVKCPSFNAGHAGGNEDRLQRSTVGKGIGADGGHRIRQCDGFQLAVSVKGIAVILCDPGHRQPIQLTGDHDILLIAPEPADSDCTIIQHGIGKLALIPRCAAGPAFALDLIVAADEPENSSMLPRRRSPYLLHMAAFYTGALLDAVHQAAHLADDCPVISIQVYAERRRTVYVNDLMVIIIIILVPHRYIIIQRSDWNIDCLVDGMRARHIIAAPVEVRMAHCASVVPRHIHKMPVVLQLDNIPCM